MSKHNHRHASRGDAPNAPITEPIPQPTTEKTMETQTQTATEVAKEVAAPTPPEASGPTAKQMAAAEEINQTRALKLAAQAEAPEPEPPVDMRELAAQGRDALHEQFRRHNENQAKQKAYVPPPRTERQMSALQEELEAGARANARSIAQQEAARPPAPVETANEGFTTPVYRPNDMVPDPVTKKLGAFSPDA